MEDNMAFRDQQKYLEALRKYERKFSREETEMYKMFHRRYMSNVL